MTVQIIPHCDLSIALEDLRAFLGPATCKAWLFSRLHPAGPTCPTCGTVTDDHRAVQRFQDMRTVKCRACGSRFGAYSGTVFAGTQLDPPALVLLVMLLGLGLKDQQIAQALGCNRSTISRWRRTLQGHGAAI